MDCCSEGLSVEELIVAESLLELGGVPWMMGWGSKQKRSKMISRGDSNYEDNVGREGPNVSVKESKARSPRTPLSWSATERASVSSPGDKSDSTTRAPHRPLGSSPDFKVGRGLGVHKPPSRRGSKKKTHAELKELVNGLLLEKEELEKEKQKLLKAFQELRGQNEHLKVQVPFHSHKMEDAKLPCTPPAISSDSAQETEAPSILNLSPGFVKCEFIENLVATLPYAPMSYETSSAERSSLPQQLKSLDKSEREDSSMPTSTLSGGFRLPDLNIPVEDLPDKSENVSDDQVFLANKKAAVSAEAGKHGNELIRAKYFQNCNAQLR